MKETNELIQPVTFSNRLLNPVTFNQNATESYPRPFNMANNEWIPGDTGELIHPVSFGYKRPEVIPIDDWVPEPGDEIFKYVKGAIVLPVSRFYGLDEDSSLDYYVLSPKRCYNSPEMGRHMTLYLNYFEKFYDQDKELLSVYYQMKYLIDIGGNKYTTSAFMNDLYRYFMRGSIYYKAWCLNEDNYLLKLTYRNTKNPGLQYNDKHAKLLLIISVIMNMIIPLITHYIHVNKIASVNDFIMEAYDMLLDLYDVDLYNKLYETALSNISRNEKHNSGLWKKQDIRGKNVTTHSLSSVSNIILNIIPKYVYNGNVIKMNFTSILNNTAFQVTDIGYEFSFVSLSSSKRDQENNSEFDKFESFLTKQDEALYLQNRASCEEAMRNIELMFGPFSDEEIRFYTRELSRDRGTDSIINPFQKGLIFNLFYKYFGDPITLYAINQDDYIKLMLAAKRFLLANNMIILPYIISSKINRLITRKNINKKEYDKIKNSPLYPLLDEKYISPKVKDYVLSLLAVILSSDFQIIDCSEEFGDLHGVKLETSMADIIFEELFIYVSLI